MTIKQDLNKHPDVIKLRIKHKGEVHEFANVNIFWAFENKGFDEGMRKLGLDPSDLDKITDIAGGAIRKDKIPEYKALINKQKKEMEELKKTLRKT